MIEIFNSKKSFYRKNQVVIVIQHERKDILRKNDLRYQKLQQL